MIPAVLSALRGSHPHRCPPGIVWLLGALALAILAGCGGSSSNCGGMGGGSGYQVDGMPGLLSCGSSGSTTPPSNTTDTIVQGMTMTFGGSPLNMRGAFTQQNPGPSSYADITGLTGPTSSLSGSTSPYSVAVFGTYNIGFVYCSLQGATEWWWNTASLNLPTASSPYTLNVTYPTFTMNPVTLECQYVDTSSTWWSNVATLSGTP